jgi:hypothetical protein
MSGISISEIVKAKGQRIQELQKELSSELGSLGYEVHIVAKAGSTVHQNAQPVTLRGSKARSGQKAYWRAIHKIVEEKGCEIDEARRIYKSNKKVG